MSKYYCVHPQQIQNVKLAWKRKSDGQTQDLAEELGLSLSTINLFLKGKPIHGLSFLEICETLELNWREIAGLDSLKRQVSSLPTAVDSDDGNNASESGSAIAVFRPVDEANDVDRALDALVSTLCEMLRRLTRKAGDLLRADRTSIFLLDRQHQKLGSINAEDGEGGCLVIEIPSDRGIASLAAASSETINIPFDVYDDPRSQEAKNTDKQTGYRTYAILAWPLFDEQRDLVAVVQFINKLKSNYSLEDDLSERIDKKGFTADDETLFATFAPSILKLLEECQFCFQLTQKLRESAQLNQASAISHMGLMAQLKAQEQQLRRSLARM
jgi:transcriptional regulator with XRE-family HTH domain